MTRSTRRQITAEFHGVSQKRTPYPRCMLEAPRRTRTRLNATRRSTHQEHVPVLRAGATHHLRRCRHGGPASRMRLFARMEEFHVEEVEDAHHSQERDAAEVRCSVASHDTRPHHANRAEHLQLEIENVGEAKDPREGLGTLRSLHTTII